ncbi:MAG: ribonuclease PH [Chloroflexota bacterium]|nr:MAG: ribonuclease PH [Chloroflexota bacterium]
MPRNDGRRNDQIRPVTLIPNYIIYPEGSVLITAGKTKVLCNVTIEEEVPAWKKKSNLSSGWVTAEYAMLPRATHTRSRRETHGLGGRSQEIRRLIGRSLRASVNLEELGPRTCIIDCDVIQADGGTRTAAITGGYVALTLALQNLVERGAVSSDVFASPVAAISVGMLNGQALLDLCYEEDSAVDVDVNVVMNAKGEFIEVQGTAEGATFSREALDTMLDFAALGIEELLHIQQGLLSPLG